MTTRFTVDLNDDFSTKLSDLAIKEGTTKADIIKKAIITYHVLQKYNTDTTKLSVTNMEDEVLKDIVFL